MPDVKELRRKHTPALDSLKEILGKVIHQADKVNLALASPAAPRESQPTRDAPTRLPLNPLRQRRVQIEMAAQEALRALRGALPQTE